ncbi:hypothetical protein GCK32_012767 [Trichostrongylus colubriformis]|uniref:Uncharacterized protein n=1 Tax=Trichostrongylus colubriformis TaxID=6319 RepID=A0AAN8IM15_TRICO
MWCRAVAHYFEWVAGIPELRLMDMQEKASFVVTLIVRQVCRITALMISYWTYRHGHNGIIFGSGICYNPSEAHDHTIIRFSAPHFYLRQLGRIVVDRALKKYQTALVDHIKHSYPLLDHKAVTERISELLGTIPYLELTAQIADIHWLMMTIHNDGNMRGRLTNEIHVFSTKLSLTDDYRHH